MIEFGYSEVEDPDDPTVWILSDQTGKDLSDFVLMLINLNVDIHEAVIGETETTWGPFKSEDMNLIKLKELKNKISSREIIPESALVVYTRGAYEKADNRLPCRVFVAEKFLD